MPSPTLTLHRTPSLDTGARLLPGDHIDITTGVTTETGQVFRGMVYIALPAHPDADTIGLDHPSLSGYFEPVILKTGNGSSWLAENWREEGDKLVARFIRPWHIRAIHTASSGYVDCFRIDGEAIADEATLRAFQGNTLTPEFVSDHFAVRFSAASKVGFFGGKSAAGGGPTGKSAGAMASGIAASASPGHDAAVFQGQELLASVSLHNVRSIDLNSYPTTPRMALAADFADPGAGAEVALQTLWSEAGEFRDGVRVALDRETLERVLASGVTEKLATWPGDEEVIWIPVAVESDCPCRWQLEAVNLPFHYIRRRFVTAPTVSEDQREASLIFSPETPPQQVLPVKLPGGAITAMSMAVDIANRERVGNGIDTDPGACHQGVRLSDGQRLATALTPPEAGLYAGISLLVSLPGEDVDVSSALIRGEDSATGLPIASARRAPGRQSGRQWLRLTFDPVRLDRAPYWLVLQCHRGELVWLGADATDAVVHLYGADDRVKARNLADLAPVASLLPADNRPVNDPQLFTLLANDREVLLDRDDRHFTVHDPSTLASSHTVFVRQSAAGSLRFSNLEIAFHPADA